MNKQKQDKLHSDFFRVQFYFIIKMIIKKQKSNNGKKWTYNISESYNFVTNR